MNFPAPLITATTVPIQIVASTNGFIDAWVDFDHNGAWVDAGEQVLASYPVTAGTNSVPIFIVSTAQLGTTFARFRFSTAGGLSYEGFAPDGEVEDYAVNLLPGVNLTTAILESADPVPSGGTLTLTVQVRNEGPGNATGVLLTNTLPATLTVLSISPSQGSCNNSGGRISCSLGALANGALATVTIATRPTLPGRLTTTAFATANEGEVNPADNAVVIPAHGAAARYIRVTALKLWERSNDFRNAGFGIY